MKTPMRKLILVLAAVACAASAFEADAKAKRDTICERIAEPSADATEIIRNAKPKLNLHGGRSARKKAENCGKNAPEPIAPKP